MNWQKIKAWAYHVFIYSGIIAQRKSDIYAWTIERVRGATSQEELAYINRVCEKKIAEQDLYLKLNKQNYAKKH